MSKNFGALFGSYIVDINSYNKRPFDRSDREVHAFRRLRLVIYVRLTHEIRPSSISDI